MNWLRLAICSYMYVRNRLDMDSDCCFSFKAKSTLAIDLVTTKIYFQNLEIRV